MAPGVPSSNGIVPCTWHVVRDRRSSSVSPLIAMFDEDRPYLQAFVEEQGRRVCMQNQLSKLNGKELQSKK
jgi:hypothetical protein